MCVCPEEDLADAIALALSGTVTLVAFGDMLRVPINAAKGDVNSLAAARAAGGDVRPISSPQEAVAMARENPARPVVFFAAGFETTTAPVAAMLAEGVPDNLSVLLAARLTWPAVDMLLRDKDASLDALIAPGHVATIMGAEEWRFIPERYGLPVAVAGFSAESLLAALYSVLRQKLEGKPFLDNCYPELVSAQGNARACLLYTSTMSIRLPKRSCVRSSGTVRLAARASPCKCIEPTRAPHASRWPSAQPAPNTCRAACNAASLV